MTLEEIYLEEIYLEEIYLEEIYLDKKHFYLNMKNLIIYNNSQLHLFTFQTPIFTTLKK